MSRARHRRPRPVRDLLMGLWILALVSRCSERRARRAAPAEISHVGLSMADALAAMIPNREVAEPCPWGLSYGACLYWHSIDHIGEYQEGIAA